MSSIGYCRVSTVDQAVDGVSLDAQRARIVAWCAARESPLDPSDVYTDAGISGKRADNRPGLSAALDAVCRTGGVLVVYSLSRLARSVRDTLAIAERLAASRADLVSLTEQIDTTSAMGKMFFRLMAVLAEFERDLISERTRTALAHKRSRGERIGQVPYGRRLAPDGRTLEPDPSELEVLDLVGRLKAEGRSVRGIARELTALGHPTKHGGRCWAPSTVHQLMRPAADGRPDEDAPPDRPREPGPPAPRGDPV